MESWLKYWWINWCFIMQDFVKPWRQPDFVLSCIHWLGLELIRAPQVVEGSLQLRFSESGKLSPAMWCHWCACAIDLIAAWMKHCMTQYDYLWKYMKMTMTVYDYDYLIHLIGDDSMAKKYGTMIIAIVKTKTYRSLPMRVFPAWISNTHSYQTLSELILLCSCTTANCSQNSRNPHL